MTFEEALQHVRSMNAEEKAKLDALLHHARVAKRDVSKLALFRHWNPRDYQRPLWEYLRNGGKRACAIWHRRSGKDDVALNWTAEAAHNRVGEYWHMLPESAQGRKAIWDAVSPHTGRRRIDQAFPMEMREKTRENDMAIVFKNGSLWRVVGSDNYESLLGSTPAGVVFSEWALADPNAWAFLRPILIENDGWAIFITTPRGSNHARKTLDLAKSENGWFGQVLSAEDTGVFTEEQLQMELREYKHDYGDDEGQALFDQEYNCSFEAALLGSLYGPWLNRAAKEGRIGKVPIDRSIAVHTAWDLGVRDSTVIWFIQIAGREYRLVDYHDGAGAGLEDYVKVLEQKQNERGFNYGKHFFPHDIEVRELGNGGRSRKETLRNLGVRVTVVDQHSVMDGINATRRMLNMTWIDEKHCEKGLDALRNYRRLWDEKLRAFRNEPYHDWASHSADALRMFASGWYETAPKKKPPTPAVPSVPFDIPPGQGWLGV
jgi:hypothetical protein